LIWEGGFYVGYPERGPWQIRIELQSHEPNNALFVNDCFLGYLPVKDYVYSWFSGTFDVPSQCLHRGYNQLVIQAGELAPQMQRRGFIWDEVLFRGIYLERTSSGG
jgi:hypothetical protein